MNTEDFNKIRELINLINAMDNQITAWGFVLKHIPSSIMKVWFDDNPEFKWVTDNISDER